MKNIIGIFFLAAASVFGTVAVSYALGHKHNRTGSSFREVYEDNSPDQEGGED